MIPSQTAFKVKYENLKNTPYDYLDEEDDDNKFDDISFILKTVEELYSIDPYKVKELVREAYGLIKCQKRAFEISHNEEEFSDLQQAINFFYLVHHYQHRKKEVAFDVVTRTYGVSKDKLESVWQSLVNYKKHFGMKIGFKKKVYRTKRSRI